MALADFPHVHLEGESDQDEGHAGCNRDHDNARTEEQFAQPGAQVATRKIGQAIGQYDAHDAQQGQQQAFPPSGEEHEQQDNGGSNVDHIVHKHPVLIYGSNDIW